MRLISLTIFTFFASIVILFFVGAANESGDTNAAAMYLLVFAGPMLLLIVLNSLLLSVLRKFRSRAVWVLGAFLPIAVLIYLSFLKDIAVAHIDGSLAFVARIGAYLLCFVNLMWIIAQNRKERSFDESRTR